jgi:hypothetical protein
VQIIAKLLLINGNWNPKTEIKNKKLSEKSTPDAICKELNSISDKVFVKSCNATLRKLKN